MKKNLLISVLYTLVTTVLLGIGYPLIVTGFAQVLFPRQANGELIQQGGKLVGSRLIGQPFTAPGYFHSRPSNAGPAGYDPMQSGGSNFAPTNKALLDRVSASVQTLHAENAKAPIRIDLVPSSASGLDPDIPPAAAEFQIPRVAKERKINEDDLRALVRQHTEQRQLRFLGEPRVNVLELNLALDQIHATQ